MRNLELWLKLKVTQINSSDMLKNSICNRNIGPLLNPNTHLLTNDRLEMCSLLLDQFNSVFTSPKPEMIVHDPVSFFSCQYIIPSDDYYHTDIEIDAINELSSTSAAGPNAIPPLLLINCAAELAPALKLLFTQSLMHGYIPASFKRAAITPVFKSVIKTSPCNYRPISLTSTIIKVFERIVRKQVVAFQTSRGHLNNTQYGFRSGRSCLSALLGVFDDLMHMLSSDCAVDMIYLDFSKAFDKVDHSITQAQGPRYHWQTWHMVLPILNK